MVNFINFFYHKCFDLFKKQKLLNKINFIFNKRELGQEM